jgi:hypothetical protein
VVAGRPDAVPATSRTAVTPLAPSDGRNRDGATDTRGGTAVTAEIPAVPVAPAYGVLLPDGSIWYPGSKRKLPAPTYLRVTVWVLAFLVVLASAALIVEHYHPVWMNPLRHVITTPGQNSIPPSGGTTATTHPGSNHSSSGKFVKTFESGSSVSYSVPATSYALTITAEAGRPCYVVVKSLKTTLDLFASTIGGGATERVVVPNGSATVEAFAGGASLEVSALGKHLGTIPALEYAFTYTLNPTNR